MTDLPGPRTSRVQGLVALLCSLGAMGYALLARDVYLHETGVGGFDTGTLVREAAAGALVAAAAILGFLGLSSRDARSRTLSLFAIALTAPALGDALTWLLGLAGARPERGLFLMMSGLPMAFALVLAWRTAAGGPAAPGDRSRDDSAPPASHSAAPRSVTRVRRWIGRCVLALASLVVGLSLCEAAFRLFGPRRLELPRLLVPGSETTSLSRIALMRPYGNESPADSLSTRFPPYMFMKGWYDQPEWDYFDGDGCVDYVFNRHGLRDHDFDLQKKDGELRVVGIGDSFTFGVGVQLEDIWTEVLERNLEEIHDGPVEVINAGFVSGHTPAGYEKWLTSDGLRLQPDIVIVGLCLNDLHPGIDLYAYRTVKPVTVLGVRSELITHLQRRKLAQAPKPRAFAGLIHNDRSLMDATLAALHRTQRALDAAGIRFIVAVFPMLSGLSDEVYPYGRVMDLVIRSCKSMGIEAIDLRDGFLGREDRTLWVHPTDQHPNDVGQHLLGDGIFQHLQQP